MRALSTGPRSLQTEHDASVRAAIFEAIGRAKPPAEDAEALLAAGLAERDLRARAGAAHGIEALFRLNAKPPRVAAAETLAALHRAFAANRDEALRELILLTMHAAADRDTTTLESALHDASPQVRRLAVRDAPVRDIQQWLRDPAPMVRFDALRLAPTCAIAAGAVADASGAVLLAAIDLLGTLKCDTALLMPLVAGSRPWRVRAHALKALAGADPAQARQAIAAMPAEPVWQMRVYLAQAARAASDSVTLARLARDENPNVAIAAMTTMGDATWALGSEHSGLIRAGADRLKDASDLEARLPQLISTFQRLTNGGVMTYAILDWPY